MQNFYKALLAGVMATTTLSGCNLGVDREQTAPSEGFYFEGYIYDGVTNERIGEYSISAVQRGETINATVGDDGHFLLGPVQPDHDYMVNIEADDYRQFYAAEAQMANLPNSNDNQTTMFYEAFLFPESIMSPEVTLDFYTPDGENARPDGTLRLTPTGGSTLSAIHLDGATTIPSVGGQVWANDADRRQRTVTFEVEDGVVTVDEGALVYGVVYSGMIFGSDGYAYQAFNYTSGLEGDRTVSLGRLDPQALTLTANSLDISNLSEDAEIVLTFNQPVELAETLPRAQLREAIDDAFAITSPDFDSDGDLNVLVSNVGDDPDDQERGTSISVDGNTLTLSWARDNSNFDNRDGGDPIESVTYNSLDQINLRISDGRVDQEVNLATLLGTNALTVFVDGTSAVNPPPPLALNSTDVTGSQTAGAVTVEYTFNRNIEFDLDTFSALQMAEFVDDAFSINSPDSEPDGFFNSLPGDIQAAVQERGTSIAIAGDTLTLTWNRSLATTDVDDPILEVTFASLNFVQIRPAGTTGAEDTSLGAMAGATEIAALTP